MQKAFSSAIRGLSLGLESSSQSSLPLPTGPFKVGRTSFELTDPNRNEVYSAEPKDKRRIVVWAWYPAIPDDNSTMADYLPGKWSEADLVYQTSFGSRILKCHSLNEAPIDPQSVYPVIIFSPAGFSPLSYSALTEDLASRGYIVLGINHTYDAPITVFNDGTTIPASPKFMESINSRNMPLEESLRARSAVADYKVQDMQFLANELHAMNEDSNFLSDHLDLTRLGALGHSLGGNAALEFCRIDSRCKAAINLDGANWNKVGKVGVKGKPVMVLAAEHPEYTMPCNVLVNSGAFPDMNWCEAERAILWNGWRILRETAEPFYGITINGSKHVNFVDVQFVQLSKDSPFKAVMGSINPVAMTEIVRRCVTTFFDKHLKNDSGIRIEQLMGKNRPEISPLPL